MKSFKKFLALCFAIILATGVFSACRVGKVIYKSSSYSSNSSSKTSSVSSKSSTKNWANEISISQNSQEIFTYTKNGYITGLTSYGNTLSTLYIPSSINGTKIETISGNAFENKTMTTVYVLPGIKTIGGNTFMRCKNLKKVYIADTVTYLGASTFESCSVLEEIILSINIDRIRERTFFSCTQLKEIVIPKRTKTIERKAFVGCKNLKKVIFELNTGWTVNDYTQTIKIDGTDAESVARQITGNYSDYYWANT